MFENSNQLVASDFLKYAAVYVKCPVCHVGPTGHFASSSCSHCFRYGANLEPGCLRPCGPRAEWPLCVCWGGGQVMFSHGFHDCIWEVSGLHSVILMLVQ